MKTRNIFLLALTALFAVSCHSWDAPADGAGMDHFGNKFIQATNVKTIAEIKSLCQKEIDGNSLREITQPMQIQGVIIGDDEGSNLYKQLYIKDGTGALCLSIDKSGLYTTAGVGQCIMVELQGLYVGGYGKQGQIGVSYTNPTKEGATPQIGRMSRFVWEDHYKLIPTIDGLDVVPIPVKSLDNLDIAKDCGKLVKLCGVKMKDADGTATFAPSDGSAKLIGGCVNREIDGSSSTVVRTSTYAKFASKIMPTEKINITGIAARYNDTWQIMIRTLNDIEPYKGDEKTIDDYEEAAPAGSGTVADPYNVAAALEKANLLPKIENNNEANASNSMVDVVVKGYVKTISIDISYGNATYYICDNAKGLGKALEVYRGLSVGSAKFKKNDEVKVGDLVVVQGTIVNFKGTLEFTTGSKILSLNGEGESGGGDTPAPSATYLDVTFASGQGDFTIDDKEKGSLTYVWTHDSTNKYMKASAFANKAANASESWLISPAFSLKNATSPVMTFNNACNQVKTGTITDHIKVMVYDGANWTEATIANMPNGTSWTFVDSTVDLKSVAGKEGVKIAFKYVSTTEIAPTWEIKTVSIK